MKEGPKRYSSNMTNNQVKSPSKRLPGRENGNLPTMSYRFINPHDGVQSALLERLTPLGALCSVTLTNRPFGRCRSIDDSSTPFFFHGDANSETPVETWGWQRAT